MKYQNSFRQLAVWQKGKELTLLIYEITKSFPPEEKFAMASQMRRASYSLLSNVAEGNTKNHLKDRCNFFNIAKGSLVELDCFSEIAFELGYIKKEVYNKIIENINKTAYLLNKFIGSQKIIL
jgi:four helix bundle protein